MDISRPTSAARRSIPPKPDTSLAEWTSKIKAMQKQVDEDEEAETRRLEAEIAASRQARLRRSTLGSRANSVDLSNSGIAAAIKAEDRSVVSDAPLSAKDKQRNQDDALRKLMGEDPAPPKPSFPTTPTTGSAPSKRPSSPISLAAFIGGRATGPRLTRHAPQQDAHDPTQFEQRTHVTTPHPVFGRGGVAMPGMTGHASASITARAIREEEAKHPTPASALSHRERRISTPASGLSVRFAVDDEQDRPREAVSTHTASSQVSVRQRTMSTPTGVSPTKATSPAIMTLSKPSSPPTVAVTPSKVSPPAETFTTKPKADPIPRPLSHSPNPIIRPITHRTSNSSLPHSGSKSPAPRPASAASYTPPSPTRSPKPVPLPGLARPIQPSPRPSYGVPQAPPSHNPSPAFLRPPPAKEPTPSLSRLQGRGFVKKVVEKSASLEVTPEGSATPDKGLSPGRRQSSVLDRWQHAGSASPTTPPVISPKPMPLRKSFTADPSSPTTSSYSVPLKSDTTGPVLKSRASLPSLQAMRTGESVGASSVVSDSGPGPKLGSAKTVITFIEPVKTGDRPVSPPRSHVTGEVDELGMRVRSRTTSGGLVQERGEAGLPAATAGKPLSHPTKERAKKPRRDKSATTASSASKLTAIREASPSRSQPAPSIHHHLHVTPQERSVPSLTPPQTIIPVRTTSPISQYPSPPASTGRAPPVSSKPSLPKKPSLDVLLPQPAPATATPAKLSPTTTSPLAPPPAAHSPSITPPQSTAQKSERAPPPSPRHARIPSTGNRATVMDVAQTFTEVLQRSPVLPAEFRVADAPQPPAPVEHAQAQAQEEGEDWEPPNVRNMIANWGPRSVGGAGGAGSGAGIAAGANSTSAPPGANGVNGHEYGYGRGLPQARPTMVSAPPMEKRKSSYEKYSAFIMPPLKEERTPVSSPAGTMKREGAPDPRLLDEVVEDDLLEKKGTEVVVEEMLVEELKPAAVPAPEPEVQVKPSVRDELIRLVHNDEPLPHVNVDVLYQTPKQTYTPSADVSTISVEVLSLTGTTASPLAKDAHVFYDTEMLVIIHRAKVRSSGLVASTVWTWRGRRATPSERELSKAQELARRYGTALVAVEQAKEPAELVHVLGGTLATRQGTRAHWSAENTAMHLVRSRQGVIYIDELDLGIKNLCSGFSYCVSILDTLYVWHGRGSTSSEQHAARTYAETLALAPESVLELTEEESEAEEMFWMILGEGDYARADYWRWRPQAEHGDPRVWAVDARAQGEDVVRPLDGFPPHPDFHHAVYLVDCVWELFVLVGSEARGRRLEIRLALSVAEALAKKASSTRPFKPTVHALIFPTQIPTDLLLTFRELDEPELNAGDIPDHMNLIPAVDAAADLKSTTWTATALQDHTMLPLGVKPTSLS